VKINRRQRIILAVAIGVLGIMVLFPPFRDPNFLFLWNSVDKGYVGYRFILSDAEFLRVDLARLIAQWVGLVLIGGIAFLFANNRRGK
jgi:hypothetical protein